MDRQTDTNSHCILQDMVLTEFAAQKALNLSPLLPLATRSTPNCIRPVGLQDDRLSHLSTGPNSTPSLVESRIVNKMWKTFIHPLANSVSSSLQGYATILHMISVPIQAMRQWVTQLVENERIFFSFWFLLIPYVLRLKGKSLKKSLMYTQWQ